MSGIKIFRYFPVRMSRDEISKLENRLAEECEWKKKLEKVYETRKVENERRMQLENERDKVLLCKNKLFYFVK